MKPFYAICFVISSLQLSAASPVEQALELCRAEQNSLRRLTCYDAINTDINPSTSTSAVVISKPAVQEAIAVEDVTSAEASVESKFGLEHKVIDDEVADKLSVTVSSVSYSPRKELIVTFDNGQRWRQIGTEHYSIAVGEQHYVKRGVLNSFLLGNNNNNRSIKVKRDK